MRFTIERKVFLSALSRLQAVVERRTTVPILSNILLRATADRLILQATDLDIEMHEEIEVAVAVSGATTVSALLLYDIVRKSPDEAVLTLESAQEGRFLDVSWGRSHFSLQALSASEFPSFSDETFSHTFSLLASDLRMLLDRVRSSMAHDDVRYFLNAVYLHIIEKEGKFVLRSIATDGHRLARADLACPEGARGMEGILIPRKTVLELSKFLEGEEGEVQVSVSPSKARFAFGKAVVTSKLIDGTFPDYSRVIPEDNAHMMEVDTRVLLKAVDRVSTLVSDKGYGVSFKLEGASELVVSLAASVGSGEEAVPVVYHGDPIEISFNPRYVLDVLTQFKNESIVFKLQDAVSSALVHDTEGDNVLYVLMPMRV